MKRTLILLSVSAGLALAAGCMPFTAQAAKSAPPARKVATETATAEVKAVEAPAAAALVTPPDCNHQLPREDWLTPFAQQTPIVFVNRSQNQALWDKLPTFWNETTEKARDPKTGQEVERKVVQIKVPLGLTQNPRIPEENPLTVAKVALGKQLYFDPILSGDGTVSCATCHDPKKGYGDQAPHSTGIKNQKGGISSPTVRNSAYHTFQFWDGRASSLEDQAQGPVGNPIEMFGRNDPADTHAWPEAIARIRAKPEYVAQFKAVFGTEPTRDATVKAIAAYERLVLTGDSIHDRAEVVARARVAEDGGNDFTPKAVDYEEVLKAAQAKKEATLLDALRLPADAAEAQVKTLAASIAQGRALFFGKARCNTCHAGDNYTDNLFHNLGVGAKDDELLPGQEGRYARLPTGHKNPALMGAFKTPTVRSVVDTAPYMHDGSEKTLEEVVDFYDRGGNANEFLDPNMRDIDKEREYAVLGAEQFKAKYPTVAVVLCGPYKKPIIPLKLNLTTQEKADLVNFMRALQGTPHDPIVAEPSVAPKVAAK